MVDDLLFKEGDYVVYPTHGVGKVESIKNQEIAGQSLELIVISFEGSLRSGSESFAVANSSLSAEYKPMVVTYETGRSVDTVFVTIWLADRYVGFEL